MVPLERAAAAGLAAAPSSAAAMARPARRWRVRDMRVVSMTGFLLVRKVGAACSSPAACALSTLCLGRLKGAPAGLRRGRHSGGGASGGGGRVPKSKDPPDKGGSL